MQTPRRERLVFLARRRRRTRLVLLTAATFACAGVLLVSLRWAG